MLPTSGFPYSDLVGSLKQQQQHHAGSPLPRRVETGATFGEGGGHMADSATKRTGEDDDDDDNDVEMKVKEELGQGNDVNRSTNQQILSKTDDRSIQTAPPCITSTATIENGADSHAGGSHEDREGETNTIERGRGGTEEGVKGGAPCDENKSKREPDWYGCEYSCGYGIIPQSYY